MSQIPSVVSQPSPPAVMQDDCFSYCSSLVDRIVAFIQTILQLLCSCCFASPQAPALVEKTTVVDNGAFEGFLKECPLLEEIFNGNGLVQMHRYVANERILVKEEWCDVNKDQAREKFNECLSHHQAGRAQLMDILFKKGDQQVRFDGRTYKVQPGQSPDWRFQGSPQIPTPNLPMTSAFRILSHGKELASESANNKILMEYVDTYDHMKEALLKAWQTHQEIESFTAIWTASTAKGFCRMEYLVIRSKS